MVITYNPGPLWSSPGLILKRFYCSWGWDQGCLEGGCRRSWGPSEEDWGGPARWWCFKSSYPWELRLFSQFNCSDWPCSGISCHHWKKEQLQQIFRLAWARVELTRHFYFTETLGQTYFFIDTNCLLFLDTVGMRAPQPLCEVRPQQEHSLWDQRPLAGGVMDRYDQFKGL